VAIVFFFFWIVFFFLRAMDLHPGPSAATTGSVSNPVSICLGPKMTKIVVDGL